MVNISLRYSASPLVLMGGGGEPYGKFVFCILEEDEEGGQEVVSDLVWWESTKKVELPLHLNP